MSTLAVMKARIASELRRSNITTQIAEAISTAIGAYEHERTYANESRENTFTTVALQRNYGSSDASFIQYLTKIDYVYMLLGESSFEVLPENLKYLEDVNSNSALNGQPGWYSYYDEQFWLYPIPAESGWTIRVAGTLSIQEPASDEETGNFWMTKGERLIRSRAKQELALHVLFDDILAERMGGAANEALSQLFVRTTRITKTGGGRVKPMPF